MEKTYEAPSNEAPHMLLGYHQGRLMMYLLFSRTDEISLNCWLPVGFMNFVGEAVWYIN